MSEIFTDDAAQTQTIKPRMVDVAGRPTILPTVPLTPNPKDDGPTKQPDIKDDEDSLREFFRWDENDVIVSEALKSYLAQFDADY